MMCLMQTTVSLLTFIDLFIAWPIINGIPKSEKRVRHPCKGPEKCNSLGGVIYDVNSNYLVFESKKYQLLFHGYDSITPPGQHGKRLRRSAVNTNEWPKSEDGLIYIPYSVRDYETDIRISEALAKAKREFEKHTCFRLIPRTHQKDYVTIIDHNGCWSYVGKLGGEQYLSLSNSCEHANVILHEFMHVIGFHHEQSRRDRDRHIKVNWTNIPLNEHVQFQMVKYGESFVHGKAFDIHSIMQYDRTVGGIDKKYDTMTPIHFPTERLGVDKGASFSPSDIEELNLKSMCGVDVKVYGGTYAYHGDK